MNAITEASTPSPRHDWTLAQAERLFALPFTTLLFEAQRTHQAYHDPATVQMSTLLSIKTGACPEDCAYCPQSIRYDTGVEVEALMPLEQVLERARAARAPWRGDAESRAARGRRRSGTI